MASELSHPTGSGRPAGTPEEDPDAGHRYHEGVQARINARMQVFQRRHAEGPPPRRRNDWVSAAVGSTPRSSRKDGAQDADDESGFMPSWLASWLRRAECCTSSYRSSEWNG
mmetsp:Transcript_59572/g.141752  ORF Transcript_59572/g.141752 Transcript_59572/m.141752 type:complete len:112 (-) Transcript_59572:22-357(-)